MPDSSSGRFIDTNVLLHLAGQDEAKAARAEAVVAAGGTVSVQVLNEIAHMARRKMGFSWAETREFLATLCLLLEVVPLTAETHDLGLALAERYGFSVYDAMIVAASVHAGCGMLLSEDMQDGMVIAEGVRIVDPFRGAWR